MKPTHTLTLAIVSGLSLLALISPAKADVVITEVANPTNVTQLYGSPTDYILFNDPAGNGAGTQDQTNFTTTGSTNPTVNPSTTTIDTPAGVSVASGIVWQFGGNGASIYITLGNSATYDYSDFYMGVLYNNISSSAPNYNDTALTLSEGTYPSVADNSYAVANVTTAADAGDEAIFHITGAAAGEGIYMNAVSANSGNGNQVGFGGVAFSQDAISVPSVPEPSTWAMLGAGVAALGFLVRRRAVRA